MGTKRFLPADAYTIGLIYVKPLEMNAITVMLDEEYESVPPAQGETNAYTLGRTGKHNVAIVGPARGEQGKVAIADVVGNIRWTFGVPHLPRHGYDLGKETNAGFEVTRTLNKPPGLLLQVVNAVEDKYLRQGHGERIFSPRASVDLRGSHAYESDINVRAINPVAATWLISFQYIHTVDAMAILTGYSFVSRQTGSQDVTSSEEVYISIGSCSWLGEIGY